MPSTETEQPKSQQMEMQAPQTTFQPSRLSSEQPRPTEQMTAEPVGMRGGGGGEVCCGICAGLACFECFECCC